MDQILTPVFHSIFLIGMPGGLEIAVILLIFLLFFGAKRIPELARGLGRGIHEFRRAADDIKKEIDESKNELNGNTSNKEKNSSSDL